MRLLLVTLSLFYSLHSIAQVNDTKNFSEFAGYSGTCKKLIVADKNMVNECLDVFVAGRDDGYFPILFNYQSASVAFYGKETTKRYGNRSFAVEFIVVQKPDNSQVRENVSGDCRISGVDVKDRLITCSVVTTTTNQHYAGEFQSAEGSQEARGQGL